MTPQRLRVVELGADLTPEEIAAGYHFCMEWDGMCVHPDDPEAEACGCPLRNATPGVNQVEVPRKEKG